MTWTTLALTAALAALPGEAAVKEGSGKKDFAAEEKAFRELADYYNGGVWWGKGADGYTIEYRFDWVLDKAFHRVIWKNGDYSGISFAGVDPASGKLGCWEFDNSGRVCKGTVVIDSPDVLVWSSSGRGKDGPVSWKSRSTKRSADEYTIEILENVVGGKKQPTGVFTLRRMKEAPKPDKADKKETATKAPAAAERAFREWGDWMAGGVWVFTDSEGSTSEERWEWILDKAFLMGNWKIGKDMGLSLAGMEPATGKLACWEFDDKGRVWKGTVTADKDTWTWSSEGQGKNGRSMWKSRATKVGPDEGRSELLEQVEDGKKLPARTATSKRKK
jgi:hypothetical protein